MSGGVCKSRGAINTYILTSIHTVSISMTPCGLPQGEVLGKAVIVCSISATVLFKPCPWFFDKDTEPLQVFCITFIVSWLGLFKVLAFCWGRAPLRESMTVAQIAASLALPLFPKPVTRKKAAPEGRLQDSAGSGAALVATWLGKTALGVVVVLSYMEYRDVVPAVLKHYLLAFTLYSMSGILMDGPAALVVALLELPVLPTFDQPWMSWGSSGGVVRVYVWCLGLHLVFFVSGAVHEYMAWLLTGSNRISWKWTVFFWIQAPLLTLESLAGRAMRRAGLQLPRPVAIVLTHLVLQSLAYDLFFGYMEEQGISLKVVGAISDCIWAVLRPLQAALMT
ncbi:hypothetical protein VOLCADRAFT_107677 [Volvox carteri f. nagariensis]|uniref:Wax synthase domain-containing protein n=1 Tax=Volvox carteri f. nagariensis TaxID=3068 RepID=D8UFK8_VOLCA|nr:uncharacterized protein VOLCADRAFT_107677 [Volvox carteri f. nagariensis]EFJ41474.1 hypothetical protein VOLCADRAFT_107677 [Volvox carteri f. nagariensis]|eukprot:XP_002957419.1 hypothetical protein VOLCADRAFT_107677 [Volvox carteri f. nagariensis]